MKSYQVIGIGNAIVDVFSPADDSFLELMGIEKGIMQLVEKERGELLYGAMKDRVQAPGGSVANTLALSAGCMTTPLAAFTRRPWRRVAPIS
jgi:sugar/nucleoside kinase (ribokinase family)